VKERRKTNLANGKVTETSDKLLFVELVRGHLHPSHLDHLRVHGHELVLSHAHFERWRLAEVGVEVFGMERDGKGLGRRRRDVIAKRRGVGSRLDRSNSAGEHLGKPSHRLKCSDIAPGANQKGMDVQCRGARQLKCGRTIE
jgi:hypothetical protein